jgi:hypothetical protein
VQSHLEVEHISLGVVLQLAHHVRRAFLPFGKDGVYVFIADTLALLRPEDLVGTELDHIHHILLGHLLALSQDGTTKVRKLREMV